MKKGSLQVRGFDFPINNKGRQFSLSFYKPNSTRDLNILSNEFLFKTYEVKYKPKLDLLKYSMELQLILIDDI